MHCRWVSALDEIKEGRGKKKEHREKKKKIRKKKQKKLGLIGWKRGFVPEKRRSDGQIAGIHSGVRSWRLNAPR